MVYGRMESFAEGEVVLRRDLSREKLNVQKRAENPEKEEADRAKGEVGLG